ncbi:hypothetical protein C5467_17690 [Photorhabdus khanii subsp. guanajuatensis]|uniref:Fimbrial protein n=1 Tax=Photorhabdus khanii subsp. guanajuatensis TaxID=2100166 RepID=A0A4R4JA60_9GAMM|nr:hypothetical protein C5467_17690 [Photorhabdus khanii subsp. guanajuatensis]
MNTDKTLMNRMKWGFGRRAVRCRWWPIWAGGICLSMGIFSAPLALAGEAVGQWSAEKIIQALGPPQRVRPMDNTMIRYPANGTANLDGVFPIMRDIKVTTTATPGAKLKDTKFNIRAGNTHFFMTPKVISGKYECTINARFKDGRPGTASHKYEAEAAVGNNYGTEDFLRSDSEDIENAALSELLFDMSCSGTGFSWERELSKDIEFETSRDTPVEFLINGVDFVGWGSTSGLHKDLSSNKSLSDPVTILALPVCSLASANSGSWRSVFPFGEVRQSYGPYPATIYNGDGSERFGLRLIIDCTVSDKKNATGGNVILTLSTPYPDGDGISVPGKPLRVELKLRSIGQSTTLASGIAIGKSIPFSREAKDILNFSVQNQPQTTRSTNDFTVALIQTGAIQAKDYGPFETSMDVTLVVK